MSAHPSALALRELGSARRSMRWREHGFRLLLFGCLAASIGVLILLFQDIFRDALSEVGDSGRVALDGKLFTEFSTTQQAKAPNAGLQSAITGTLWLIAICALFIVPVGVATAIYLEEYADGERWWNRLIEVNIQNLAAVPSVVYGILGLAFIVRGPLSLGNVVLAGGLTLGLLVLPVVIIAGREALRAVPPSIREGSMALGATQWQTIWKQVLPAAVPGIATGVILALSRAIGETAPLILIGAAAFAAFNPGGPFDDFTALPIQIYTWISLPQPEFKALAAAGMVILLVILVSMNAIAIWLRNRYEQKW